MSDVRLQSRSADETRAIGTALGKSLRGGELIAFDGPLGAGKTQLAKGLALGLGVAPEEPVVSPTFVLVREYAGRLRLIHIDAYRLHAAADLLELGFDEFRAPGSVVVVEWAERVATGLGAPDIHVDIAYGDSSDPPHAAAAAASESAESMRSLHVRFANPAVEQEFRRRWRSD